MSMMFEKEIAELKARGIEITDLKADEICALVEATKRCAHPFSRVNAELVGMPITVCEGVYFWKLTVGASVWLDQYAKKWWLDTGQRKAYFWAIVYAMIHAREKDAFLSLVDEHEAYERIKADALRLTIREAEVTDAMDYALSLRETEPKSQTQEREQPSVEQDWASLIGRIETQSGIPAEKWIWDYSLDYTRRAYYDLSRFARAMSGQKVSRMKDELDHALNHLARVRASIIQRIEQEKERGNE